MAQADCRLHHIPDADAEWPRGIPAACADIKDLEQVRNHERVARARTSWYLYEERASGPLPNSSIGILHTGERLQSRAQSPHCRRMPLVSGGGEGLCVPLCGIRQD